MNIQVVSSNPKRSLLATGCSVIGSLVCCLAFSGVFIFIFGNAYSLNCTRGADKIINCTRETKFLGMVHLSTLEINDVVRVQTVSSCDSDGCAYRPELITADGQSFGVYEVYGGQNKANETTGSISAFINGAAESFSYP